MYVLRFFISTLFLVSVIVGSVFGFIYWNEVMRKVTVLSGDVVALLHEQGWIIPSPVAKRQEDAVKLPHLPTSPSVPAPAPVPATPSLPVVVPLLPPPPPAAGISGAKTDYPPPDDYIPAGPERELQRHSANKSVSSKPSPAIPPASLPEKGTGNIPSTDDTLTLTLQTPHETPLVGAREQEPAFDPYRADSFAAPFNGFLPPSAPLTKKQESSPGLLPSSPSYGSGELQADQDADSTTVKHEDMGMIEIKPSVMPNNYKLPESSPPSATPSYMPNSSNQNEQNIQRNHGVNELPITQTTPSSPSRWDAPSFTGRPSLDLHFHPAIPSRSIGDEQRTQSSIALREAWVAARRSFWEKDPVTAEKAYQTLLRDYPDEPDLAGELGNIYLNRGRWQEATSLYYEAGMRALRTSNRGQVNAVIGILYQLDPAKAEVLRQNMMASHIPW